MFMEGLFVFNSQQRSGLDMFRQCWNLQFLVIGVFVFWDALERHISAKNKSKSHSSSFADLEKAVDVSN